MAAVAALGAASPAAVGVTAACTTALLDRSCSNSNSNWRCMCTSCKPCSSLSAASNSSWRCLRASCRPCSFPRRSCSKTPASPAPVSCAGTSGSFGAASTRRADPLSSSASSVPSSTPSSILDSPGASSAPTTSGSSVSSTIRWCCTLAGPSMLAINSPSASSGASASSSTSSVVSAVRWFSTSAMSSMLAIISPSASSRALARVVSSCGDIRAIAPLSAMLAGPPTNCSNKSSTLDFDIDTSASELLAGRRGASIQARKQASNTSKRLELQNRCHHPRHPCCSAVADDSTW
mmetsp:Transcript_128478/g.324283  ORF Transcript_128478/g.324283 Transcript_128478/m.324283 type:complete len:292 (+) Transcript_128478:148-1023(+)